MLTEWEKIKMEVGNEIEIFITWTKYNTCQWSEEGETTAGGDDLVYFHPFTIVSNVFMRSGTYSLMFIVRVYNIYICE